MLRPPNEELPVLTKAPPARRKKKSLSSVGQHVQRDIIDRVAEDIDDDIAEHVQEDIVRHGQEHLGPRKLGKLEQQADAQATAQKKKRLKRKQRRMPKAARKGGAAAKQREKPLVKFSSLKQMVLAAEILGQPRALRPFSIEDDALR